MVTDHRPLTALFGPKCVIPPLAAGHLQRWALLLSSYSYTIEFRPTKSHANADSLSRLPLQDASSGECLSDISVYNVSQISVLPVSVVQVGKATRADPVLSKVVHYFKTGCPVKVPDTLKPYFTHHDEMSIEEGCDPVQRREFVMLKLNRSSDMTNMAKIVPLLVVRLFGLEIFVEVLSGFQE